jgi:hypothetical protein
MECQTSVTCILCIVEQANEPREIAIQTSSTPGKPQRAREDVFSKPNHKHCETRPHAPSWKSRGKNQELAGTFPSIAAEMGIWGDYRERCCGNGFPSSFDVEFTDVGLQEGLIRRLHSRYVGHQYVCRRDKTPVETTVIQPQVGRPINLVIYPSSRASRIPKRLPSDSLSPRVPPPCPMVSREGPHSVIAAVIAQTNRAHSFIEL